MNLQDDLARNRRVFEILTGERREQDAYCRPRVKNAMNQDTAQPRLEGNGFAPPKGAAEASRARAGVRPPDETADAVFQTARARGFSLNHGTVDLPVGFSGLPGIGSVTYPEIRPEAGFTPPERIDPLESIYGRVETQARMASQLSREEGFFGF